MIYVVNETLETRLDKAWRRLQKIAEPRKSSISQPDLDELTVDLFERLVDVAAVWLGETVAERERILREQQS